MSRCNLLESSDSEEDELDSLCNNNACSSGKTSAWYSSVAQYEQSSFLHSTLNNSSRSLNKSIDNIQTRVVQSSSTPIVITSSNKSNTSMLSTEEEKEKGRLHSLLVNIYIKVYTKYYKGRLYSLLVNIQIYIRYDTLYEVFFDSFYVQQNRVIWVPYGDWEGCWSEHSVS